LTEKEIVLKVSGLKVGFRSESQDLLTAVDGISFDLRRGETLGLVGESGCGKSVTALTMMRLLPQPLGKIVEGQILLKDGPDWIDILKVPAEELFRIRGRRIAMIFQEPMTALNPVHTIGRQLFESFRLHFPELSNSEIERRSIEILEQVGISSPEKRILEYPHQLSGGMRQRVLIAIALSGDPDILVADEPTTALDVTIQAQILDLLHKLQKERGLSVLFITHDLGVVAQMCERMIVMYAGRAAESGTSIEIFAHPRHPYTKGLLASIPRLHSIQKSELPVIEGMVPALKDMAHGCHFQSRCKFVTDRCRSEIPVYEQDGSRYQACWNWRNHE
jgi:oligopeptide/dipeptide ABC transporter ATP-binding protein